MSQPPRLSVIICIYNMAREAPRTILSAALPYQKGIERGDYEVIVVDNGSSEPLRDADRERLPQGMSLVSMPDPHPSPVFALNWAAKELAKGDILMFAIDGARIFSDRLFATALAAHDLVDDAFVYTLGWHLGPKVQTLAVQEGYNQQVEDLLITDSGWPEQPRRLFDISVLAGSSRDGYFRPIRESNAFSMPRALFTRLNGYDERFVSPGGGLANLEIFQRYVTRAKARNICLLSEGTFHQVHGGAATSGALPRQSFRAEYRTIFGREFRATEYDTLYYCSGNMEFARFMSMASPPAPGRTS